MDLSERAVRALDDSEDAHLVGRQIGAALVEIGFTASDALGRTVHVLSEHLVSGLVPDEMHARRSRVAELLSGLTSEFAVAARERLLSEQEHSRRAVLAENRRAVEAIRRQAALLDLASDAIIMRGLDGRILFWNRGAEVLYGWGRAEALGAIIHDLLRTQFPLPWRDLQATLSREGTWQGELVHTCRDGSVITVSSRWAKQNADGDQPEAILEINTDITARKGMEAILREREQSLEFAQTLVHLGSWQFTIPTSETYWSPEAYRLLGYAQGEIEPSLDAYLRHVHPDDMPRLQRAIRESYAGKPYVLEHRIVAAAGVERVLLAQAQAVRDEHGAVVRLLGTILDVTERKQAEAERMQLLAAQAARTEAEGAQQRLAFLAEASTRLASSLDYELTLRNVTELTVPALADVCILDLLPENGERERRIVATRLDTAIEQDLERHWTGSSDVHPLAAALQRRQSAAFADIHHLGRLVDPSAARAMRAAGIRCAIVVPVLARGRVLGAITCFGTADRAPYTPIEHALAEELGHRCGLAIDNARLHAEAQRATRLRDEFLSVAAHELKTPMTTLRGYAQLLGRSLEPGVPPPELILRRSVGAIETQSEKLVKLTEQLLDVSRIEAGKLRLSTSIIDLVDLLRGIVQSIQDTTTKHTLTVIAPQRCIARVDAMRLEQVLANLVGNAVKYSPNGGPIEVSLTTPTDNWVRLKVRDWGLGVPDDRRAALFDRFYQAHGEGHFGGLGLGLYVSRQIVELHGGTISAVFPSDGGSEFAIEMPLDSERMLAARVASDHV